MNSLSRDKSFRSLYTGESCSVLSKTYSTSDELTSEEEATNTLATLRISAACIWNNNNFVSTKLKSVENDANFKQVTNLDLGSKMTAS